MKTSRTILVAVLVPALALASGCKPRAKDSKAEGFGTGRVSLKGTYGLHKGPEIEPVLKVEEAKTGGYTFEERVSDQWLADPETPHIPTEADLLRSFHGPVGAATYGLSTSKIAIYKVPEGWSKGSFKTNTGYILFTDAGPEELTKMLGN